MPHAPSRERQDAARRAAEGVASRRLQGGKQMGPRRAAGVSYEVVDHQAVLIDPDGTELITLNPVGTRIWEELDGGRGTSELATDLLPSFDGVTCDGLERD